MARCCHLVNENGTNDGEPGLNDVVINLLDASEQIIATATTAQGGGLDSGYYQLTNVPPGSYTVQFIRPLFYQFIEACMNHSDITLSPKVEDSTP